MSQLPAVQGQLAVQPVTLSAGEVLTGVLQAGVTPENAASVEKIVALMREERKDAARMTFNAALRQLQADTGRVIAQKVVPNRDGTARYTYAPFEAIMAQVQPLLDKHGFSLRFDVDCPGERMKVTCYVMHDSGHEISASSWQRVSNGPPGGTVTQADSGAITTGKRYALCNALNIVVEQDDNPGAYAGHITAEQADELRRRVQAIKGNDKAFLRMAKAETYETIDRTKLGMLDEELRKKGI